MERDEVNKKQWVELHKNKRYRPKYPSEMVVQFVFRNFDRNGQTKILDLGCGAGRDTIELLKNNWNVLSIDKEDTESIIREQLSQKESENFKFKKCFFGEMNLPKVNLIVANFSLPFSKKEFFSDIWKNITNSLSDERVFCWKFFWKKRYMGRNKRKSNIFNRTRSQSSF